MSGLGNIWKRSHYFLVCSALALDINYHYAVYGGHQKKLKLFNESAGIFKVIIACKKIILTRHTHYLSL